MWLTSRPHGSPARAQPPPPGRGGGRAGHGATVRQMRRRCDVLPRSRPGRAAEDRRPRVCGVRTHWTTVSDGEFHCPECGGDRNYQRRTGRRRLTLLGLPVLPRGEAGPVVECASCVSRFPTDVLARPTTTRFSALLRDAVHTVALAVLAAAWHRLAHRAGRRRGGGPRRRGRGLHRRAAHRRRRRAGRRHRTADRRRGRRGPARGRAARGARPARPAPRRPRPRLAAAARRRRSPWPTAPTPRPNATCSPPSAPPSPCPAKRWPTSSPPPAPPPETRGTDRPRPYGTMGP